MIASPCNLCCFLKDGKCQQDQFFISTPKSNFAPGFCRKWRPNKWTEGKSPSELIQLSIEESKLNYALVIIHNNDDNLETLEKNLFINSTNNICKRIIIADVTRKTNRSQIIDLFKNHKGPKNLDILVADHEEEKPIQTIKRISRTIKEKYFVVIPSSKILTNEDNYLMIEEINNKNTRFIFYPFINKLAQTIILSIVPFYGLYVTPSYKTLTQSTEIPKTFLEKLKEEELTTGICLSCPLGVIIDG